MPGFSYRNLGNGRGKYSVIREFGIEGTRLKIDCAVIGNEPCELNLLCPRVLLEFKAVSILKALLYKQVIERLLTDSNKLRDFLSNHYDNCGRCRKSKTTELYVVQLANVPQKPLRNDLKPYIAPSHYRKLEEISDSNIINNSSKVFKAFKKNLRNELDANPHIVHGKIKAGSLLSTPIEIHYWIIKVNQNNMP